MKALRFIIPLLALAPLATFGAETPNIILVMTDDQGWGDVGYNGHLHLKTPHLDQMHREGLTFTRFYAGAAMCSPTRGSCYTGRNPYRYGINLLPFVTGEQNERKKPLGFLNKDGKESAWMEQRYKFITAH